MANPLTLGAIAWLALGRPVYAGWRPGGAGGRETRRVVGPEDRPDFGSSKPPDRDRLEAWEADLLRRERELRRKEPEDPPPPTTW